MHRLYYVLVRNIIHPEPSAPRHSEGAERPKNLVQSKLPEGSRDGPSRSW